MFMTDCPFAVRFYLTAADRRDAYQDAAATVTAMGFEVEREFDPSCSRGESGAGCAFTALRGDDRITAVIYREGTDDGTGVARPDRVTIRLIAED